MKESLINDIKGIDVSEFDQGTVSRSIETGIFVYRGIKQRFDNAKKLHKQPEKKKRKTLHKTSWMPPHTKKCHQYIKMLFDKEGTKVLRVDKHTGKKKKGQPDFVDGLTFLLCRIDYNSNNMV